MSKSNYKLVSRQIGMKEMYNVSPSKICSLSCCWGVRFLSPASLPDLMIPVPFV